MNLPTIKALKRLHREATPPCVSIYLPTNRGGQHALQNVTRLKNALSQAANDLQTHPRFRREREGDAFLEPIRGLLDKPGFWRRQSDGLALFASEDTFDHYRLPHRFETLVAVGDRFHLSPFISLLADDGLFWILAISANRVRLLQASRQTVREVDRGDIPASLAETVRYDDEEKTLQFHTGAPAHRREGRRDAVLFGHGGPDPDNRAQERFLRLVEQGFRRLVNGSRLPLVLAAVDRAVAGFSAVNRYPDLISDAVFGNPDELSADDLQTRAWPLVERRFRETRLKAAARFPELQPRGLAGRDLRRILAAAHHGRVDTLFLPADTQVWGRFDVQTEKMTVHDPRGPLDEDLLNLAATETLVNKGSVYVVPPDEVPAGGPAAALYRYVRKR